MKSTFLKRSVSWMLACIMLIQMIPAEIFAYSSSEAGDDSYNRSTYKPSTCQGRAVLAMYTAGDHFPGEPATHSSGDYLRLKTDFTAGGGDWFKASEILNGAQVLQDIKSGSGGAWGVFGEAGIAEAYFTQSFRDQLAANHAKIVKAALAAEGTTITDGQAVNYDIVWYVVKFQYRNMLTGWLDWGPEWHINGLVVEKDKYTVNYVGNGATNGVPDGDINLTYADLQGYNVKAGSGMTIGSDYIFAGWNTQADGNGIFYRAGEPGDMTKAAERHNTNNIVLYAQWTERNKYSVTWQNSVTDEIIHMDTAVTDGSSVSYDGRELDYQTDTHIYTFKHWTTKKDGSGTKYNKTDSITVTGNLTLYAQYEQAERTYLVTWKNGGDTLEADTVKYNGKASYNGALPTKASTVEQVFTFSGWNTAADGSGTGYAPDAELAVTENMTLYAQFTATPRIYTITWMNGDKQVWQTTAQYNGQVTYDAAAAPTKASTVEKVYTFQHWTTNSDGSGTAYMLKDSVTVTGDLTLYAQFTDAARPYTVTWVNHNGSLLTTTQVRYGEMPVYPDNTDKLNYQIEHHIYTFRGWLPTLSEVTGDVTYKADFDEEHILFTATVKSWLDPVITNGLVTDGTLVDLSDMLKSEQVAFYLQPISGGEPVLMTRTATGVYTAQVRHDTYRVVVKGGSYSDYTSFTDERITVPQDTSVAEDSTTADVLFYSVTYKPEGGKINDSAADIKEDWHRGTDLTVSNYIPVREGYDFLGWKLDGGETLLHAGDPITDSSIGIAQPHVLTAQWTKALRANVTVKVTIHHHTQSGAGINPQWEQGDLEINLTHRQKETDLFVEKVGFEKAYPNGSWRTDDNTEEKDGKITTTLTAAYQVSGLPNDWEYSANVMMRDYAIILGGRTVTKTPDADGNMSYVVEVEMQYWPDSFDLNFEVKADPSIPKDLIPTAVDFQILSWDANQASQWAPISRHQHSAMDVRFTEQLSGYTDANRLGTGTYTLPVYKTGGGNYYYRVAVAGFTLADGTELNASALTGMTVYQSDDTRDPDQRVIVYHYAAGAYRAEVTVTGVADIGGQTAVLGEQTGTDSDGKPIYGQTGTVSVVVYMNAPTVTFDPNGGTLNGSADDTVLEHQFRIPNLAEYRPTRAGGYVFDGWAIGSASGEAAVSGEPISQNITLVAKWKEPLTISGKILIATAYTLDGEPRYIPESSLPQSFVVTLSRLQGISGVLEPIRSLTFDAVDYDTYRSNNLGLADYSIAGIPQDGSRYFVTVAITNYDEVFQNEPDSLDPSKLLVLAEYNSADNEALAGSDNRAVVNMGLFFQPDQFNLSWKVDSSAIGEGFRPGRYGTVVRCNPVESGSDIESWPIISQHYQDGVYSPVESSAAGTVTEQSEPVWKYHSSGWSYLYAVQLYSYDGILFDANAPFVVVPEPDIAWYSDADGKQKTDVEGQEWLVLNLLPRTYSITWNKNTTDPVGGLETAPANYTWSFGLNTLPSLTRTGWKFLGWADENGDIMTAIPADMHRDLTLTAVWTEDRNNDGVADEDQIFVNFVSGPNGTLSGTNLSQVFPAGTNEHLTDTGIIKTPAAGYAFAGWLDNGYAVELDEIDLSELSGGTTLVLTASFTPDTNGDDIPDQDQVLVRFGAATGGTVSGDLVQAFLPGTVTVDPASVTATPARWYALDIWTRDGGSEAVNPFAPMPGLTAGTVIDFTAHFAYDANENRIPDKYQARITFVLDKQTGAWLVGDDVVALVNLAIKNDTTGAWIQVSPAPVLGLTIPDPAAEMRPLPGYGTAGAWTPAITAATPVTGDATYTWAFRGQSHPVTYRDVEDGAGSSVTVGNLCTILVDPNGGSWRDSTAPTVVTVTSPVTLEDPTRTGYTFLGWTCGEAAGTHAYTFTANWQINSYTVKFLNYNGTVLQSGLVEYGTVPSYQGATPTKPATAEHTYAFTGWDSALKPVAGDQTYTAQFSSTVNSYTVTWVDGDGKVLGTDTLEYGATPVYSGADPTKTADAQYTYTWTGGWDPDVDKVTGNVTYTATFTGTVNTYTVTWVDGNGQVLDTDTLKYGETPVYAGETPTKNATVDTVYTFNNTWSPAVVAVTGNATYIAGFDSAARLYTITWVNYDGTELKIEKLPYGATPVYTGAKPMKEADAQYRYAHTGKWTPEVKPVTGDQTYTAVFDAITRKYIVTWENWDGTVLQSGEVEYGETPAYTGETPTRAATAQYTYTFADWDKEITEVTGPQTYKATYTETVNKYTVTFKDWDGDVLQTGEVEYGETPAAPADPTRAATDQYAYTFEGWDKVISKVTGPQTYTATYTAAVRTYTVQWKVDGTVVETDTHVAYGQTPKYDGVTPTKAGTAQYTYTFAGWEPTVSVVTGDITYTAKFTETVNKYTVTWENWDGTVLKSEELEYDATPAYTGETPTRATTAQYTYTFAGWDKAISKVTGPQTYTATYTSEERTYTVTWVNWNGDVLEKDENVLYGTATKYDGTTPVKAGNAQFSYDFDGWTPPVSGIVTGDVTYTAQFTQRVNKYPVVFKDWDGTPLQSGELEYGETPVYNGETPTRAATVQYTYVFKEWTPAITAVAGPQTYTATYTATVNKYTVEFLNHDGTELQKSDWEYGTTPVYSGAAPTRAADNWNTYSFSGWSPAIASVTGEATYTATFTATPILYTVTWEGVNGVLETDTVGYNGTAKFDGTHITEDANHTYTFEGWYLKDDADKTVLFDDNDEPRTITGNVTYVAKYTMAHKDRPATVRVNLNKNHGESLEQIGTVTGVSYSTIWLLPADKAGETNFRNYLVPLTWDDVANAYTGSLQPGSYQIWSGADADTAVREATQLLDNRVTASGEADLYYNSVTYDLQGGSTKDNAPTVYYYKSGEPVTVKHLQPAKTGFIFKHWIEDAKTYPDTGYTTVKLTDSIVKPHTLTAVWVKEVQVQVEVTVDHTSKDGVLNNEANDTILNIYLTEKLSGNDSYTDVYNGHKTYAYGTGTGEYTTGYTEVYTGLQGDLNFSARAAITGYTVVSSVTDTDVDGNKVVRITLKYDPDGFDLTFTVKMDPNVPAALWPRAVNVRLAWFNYDANAGVGAWEAVPYTSAIVKEVVIDQSTGTGTGVWHVWSESVTGGNAGDLYLYRVAVEGFDLGETRGTLIAQDKVGGNKFVDYVSKPGTYHPASAYTASVSVVDTGCGAGAAGGLIGAHKAVVDGNSVQHGTITVTVNVHPYTLVLEDYISTTDKSFADRFLLPDLTGETRTRDGYTFRGWYTGENGTGTKVTTGGNAIKTLWPTAAPGSTVTLYAYWAKDLEISGTVDVANFYMIGGSGGTKTFIHSDGRPTSITVRLKRVDGSTTGAIIAEQVINTYAEESVEAYYRTFRYSFTGVKDNGSVYFVEVAIRNYTAQYDNEETADWGAGATNGSGHNTALDKNGDDTAQVNAQLSFEPASFDLQYKVDASAVKTQNPGHTLPTLGVFITYNSDTHTASNPLTWSPISLHKGTPFGVTLDDATGISDVKKYSVWKTHPDGDLYGYAIKVKAKIGTSWVDLDSSKYEVTYKPHRVWSNGSDGQTGDPQYNTHGYVLTAYIKLKEYTVTFVNHDGTELQTGKLPYGTKATAPANPTKTGNAQYTYTFAGWDPSFDAAAPVTGDATYTAQFDSTVNTYTVTWVNEDGTELEKDENVPYGTTPSFDGETPTKPATAQYTYSFAGWSPAIASVTGDVTYTARFDSTVNYYTIKWLDADGRTVHTEVLPYGADLAHPNITPTKAGTQQYSYTFTGWDQDIPAGTKVTGNAEYKAQFSSTVNEYTVTFVNHDGTELQSGKVSYGTTPAYNGTTPAKTATAQYSYSFSGWSPAIVAVTGDVTYTAQFSSTVNEYTVTFKNWDGTELQSGKVAYGETPAYTGTPTKAADDQYTYAFEGWEPAIVSVTGNAEYKATFKAIPRRYTITFVNHDGTELQKSEFVYDATPVYMGEAPVKQATAQYTYSFAGWSPAIVAVTGNATYTAQFDSTVNQYEITWKDGDGNTIKTEDVAYGETPAYTGATPTKARTDQYTYTWSETWSPAIVPVTGPATYTAQFNSTVNKYTVTWVNEDGTELEKDENVDYGTMPQYNGATPTKARTDQYTYFHTGWTPEEVGASLGPVTRDVTYIATFGQRTNQYPVTWKDGDGEILKTVYLDYGTVIPTYDGATPTKTGTVQFSYTFNGNWAQQPAGTTVTGAVVLTAQFTETVNEYTVTFKNWDGTELQSGKVAYGTTPAYSGATPTKARTDQYTYTFNGTWSPAIVAVTGDAVYTAQFSSTVNKYTVTWVDGNGDTLKTEQVAYGDTPAYTGETPTKTATQQYTYTWNSTWSPAIVSVTGEATYTAQFDSTVNKYQITWLDDADQVLRIDTVAYGETPSYGADPVKPMDVYATYSFKGWEPGVVAVTGNAAYKAKFEAQPRTYTVTWLGDGGTVLHTDSGLHYSDAVPAYDGPTPTKASTDQFDFAFERWNPVPYVVTGDMVYEAVFTATTRTYTVTWMDDAGNVIDTSDWFYGQTPTHADPVKVPVPGWEYTFAGWTPAIVPVTGPGHVYTATFTAENVTPPVVITYGDALLIKVDAADPTQRLSGVVFELHRIIMGKDVLMGTYTTNDLGVIRAQKLFAGSYYWREIRPKEGYMLDMTHHAFTIKAGQDTTVTVTNTRSTVPSVFSGEHFAYIVGKSETRVAPLDNITRAEIATIFYRLLSDEARTAHYQETSIFPDVARNAWYATAVTTLADMGIVKGDEHGLYNPNAPVTRAEFAAIAARFDENGNATGVTFSDIYGHWAEREIAIVARNGWVLGYEDGTFRPDQAVTRAEAMAMVNRVLQRIPQNSSDLLPGMTVYEDNQDPNAWYYLAVQEATNSHDYQRRSSGYEYWTVLRERPDWRWLEQQWVPKKESQQTPAQ